MGEYRLKEKINTRKVKLIDMEEADGEGRGEEEVGDGEGGDEKEVGDGEGGGEKEVGDGEGGV